MEYQSSNEFIKKLETDHYEIGSFDVFIDETSDWLKRNLPVGLLPVSEDALKLFPTTYRAAIVDKKTKSYVGFISPYNTDNEHQTTSIFMGLKNRLTEDEIKEIKDEYLSFLANDLALHSIKDDIVINGGEIRKIHNDIVIKDKKMPPSSLKEDIPEDVLQGFIDMGYDIPKLSFAN